MYERDPYNKDDEEALLFIPPAAKGQAYGAGRYLSRLTRDGNVSLEVEIPRRGIKRGERILVYWAMVFHCLILFAIICIVPMVFHVTGVGVLMYLFSIAVVLSVVVALPFQVKKWVFSHTYLKITTGECLLIQRNITWECFIRIICFPSHFDDLETGRIIETDPVETRHLRIPFLEARLAPNSQQSRRRTHIRLGLMSFAFGLEQEELGWLVVEINRFLFETR